MTEQHRRSFTAYDFTAAIKCFKLHLGLTCTDHVLHITTFVLDFVIHLFVIFPETLLLHSNVLILMILKESRKRNVKPQLFIFFSILHTEPVRSGHQDPGESHEGGHGHLPQDRHHGSPLRRGSAEELRERHSDVPGRDNVLHALRERICQQVALELLFHPPAGSQQPTILELPPQTNPPVCERKRVRGLGQRVRERGGRGQGGGSQWLLSQSDQRGDAADAQPLVGHAALQDGRSS